MSFRWVPPKSSSSEFQVYEDKQNEEVLVRPSSPPAPQNDINCAKSQSIDLISSGDNQSTPPSRPTNNNNNNIDGQQRFHADMSSVDVREARQQLDEAEARQQPEEESDEDRIRREEEESLELARMLMAEEAMASYQQHVSILRASADQFSEEDYNALQAALDEEDEQGQQDDEETEDGSEDLSYEAMLELGERIGDVKTEHWALCAEDEIAKLPTFLFDPRAIEEKACNDVDDSEIKCLVCQCEYEKNEKLRRLPCNHTFHAECVDQWLKTNDSCPYCRKSITDHPAN